MTHPPHQPHQPDPNHGPGHNNWMPPRPPAGDPQFSPPPGGSAFATDYPPRPPAPWIEYSSWGRRVLASLVDFLFSVPYLITYAGMASTTDYGHYNPRTGAFVRGHGPDDTLMVLTVLIGLATFAFGIWNYLYRQGKTGATLGKSAVGIRVVSEETGQPLRMGENFARQLAHILDGLACYIGYLFPLWDNKRRTFADMIMTTVVVRDTGASHMLP